MSTIIANTLTAELAENEAGIIPASPEQMSNEDLAVFVRNGLAKLADLLPYVRELRGRFAALPRGHANILGCRTWQEFCERVLNRTDSAVRKALSPPRKEPELERKLLGAVMRAAALAVPGEKGERPIWFSVSENGKLLITTAGAEHGEELDVEVVSPPGELQIDDFRIEVEIERQPFNFKLDAILLKQFLKRVEGDPVLFFHGSNHALDFREGDGILRIFNCSVPKPPRTWWCPPPPPTEEEARRQAEEDAKAKERAEEQAWAENKAWDEAKAKEKAQKEKWLKVRGLVDRLASRFHIDCTMDELGIELLFSDLTMEQLETIVETLGALPVD